MFKAISSGKTIVDFLDSSKVLIGEGEGTNILTSVNRGVYNIIPSPPKGPRIFSETHPDQNKWSKNPNPTFSWERIDEAMGYSYKLDEDPQGEPDNSIDTSATSISFENITDGVKYFHIKAIKNQVWGGTSHFQIKIDIVPPNSFEPYLEPFSLTLGNNLLIYFNAVDRLSGIDYYQVRVASLNDPQNIIFSVWTQEESPFELIKKQSGTMSVLVRAFDKAGNFQEGNIPKRFEKSDKRLAREIKEAEKEIEDIRRFKEQERKEKEHDITAREEAERKWRQLQEALRRETKSSEEDEKSDDYE